MQRSIPRSSVAVTAVLAAFGTTAYGGVAGLSSASAAAASKTPIYFGVSAAETGQYAQYGKQFQEAFTLAANQVNAAGGVDGHPVELKYEDSQSDPTQSVQVAQDFVSNPDIVLVFGDYSSSASIPASPIYTAGKLVQYGFNNSDPDFTLKGSEYQWSTSVTTAQTYEWEADYLKKKGIKSVGVTYLNTSDWGIPAYQSFKSEAAKDGIKITDAESVSESSVDDLPEVIKAIAGKPQAFVDIGYGPDGAVVVDNLRKLGYKGTFYGGQDVAAFDKDKEAQGSIEPATFVATSKKPLVVKFVKAFEKAYPKAGAVTSFEAGAYDALYVAVAAAKIAAKTDGGAITRAGILTGFKKLKDVPSVEYGTITFNQKTRQIAQPTLVPTILKNDVWVPLG